ncbi:MAG: GPW/gp25 family protein [Spirochaetales bacterium]|nr:GPW/gp25 family protein [Spirochaetales bacterium]
MRKGSFLGAGWAFPFEIDQWGNVEMSCFEKSIAESVRLILSTNKGERIMRPDFGCSINDLVFAPNNAKTQNLICHYIEEALVKWEPRIILEKVEAFTDEHDESRININIEYRIRSVNTYFNMVYPFYLERGESDTQSQFG